MSDVRIEVRAREVAGMIFWHETTTELIRTGQPVLARARAAAPVRTGALRRGIVLVNGADSNGVYVDIVSTVRSPGGFPYGVIQNARRPYLRPALRALPS